MALHGDARFRFCPNLINLPKANQFCSFFTQI